MIQCAGSSRIVYLASKSGLDFSFKTIRSSRKFQLREFAKDVGSPKQVNSKNRKENMNSSQSQSLSRKPRIQKDTSEPNKQPKETSFPDTCENVEIRRPVFTSSQVKKFPAKSTTSEPPECVIKPPSCPPPTLSQDTPPTKSKETEAPALPKSSPDSAEKGQNQPPDGGGYTKWLLGALALAAGGLGVYYFLKKNQNGENDVKPGSGARRRDKHSRSYIPIVKIPPTSADIPKEVAYLLIGGGTATFSAFRAIKSYDPKAKVLVISRESEFPYMRPPLSKELWTSDETSREKLMFRQWNGSVRSVFYEPDSFYMDPSNLDNSGKGGVSVARGWSVTAIDPLRKEVTLDDGTVIAYTKCLLAPGSKPKQLALFEEAPADIQNKVYYLRNISDFRELSEAVGKKRDVVIVGGGLLGSELASSLSRQGSGVTHIFREPGLLGKLLPVYLSKWLTLQIRSKGVNIMAESNVVAVDKRNERLVLSLASGKTVEADICIVAAGAVPDTDLEKTSKLETHSVLGGYLVNSEMQARSDLYIAGDAACFFDERFGRRRVEHHDHAVVSGRLAGENMAGARKPYTHLSMLWSDLGPDIGWEAVGLIDSTLETVGVFRIKEKSEVEQKAITQAEETTSMTPSASETVINKDSQNLNEDMSKGVIFYRKDGVIVGVLLWNLFGRIPLARQVLKEECNFNVETINELAKLFAIHEE